MPITNLKVCPILLYSSTSIHLLLAEIRNKSTAWITEVQESASDLFDAASDRLASVRDQVSTIQLPAVETPEFLTTLFNKLKEWDNAKSSEEDSNESTEPDPNNGGPGVPLVAAALGVAAVAEPDDVRQEEFTPDRTNELMHLTKKLIGIRSVLLSIDQSDSLKLPSIVVIGSQSSGKSSVLEAIVGHEFLPK